MGTFLKSKRLDMMWDIGMLIKSEFFFSFGALTGTEKEIMAEGGDAPPHHLSITFWWDC